MRHVMPGTFAFHALRSVPVLILAVLLSGCASKGARHESSLYPDGSISARSSRYARLQPPPPVPAVRGFSQRAGQAPLLDNDEARYSAVYGVPARPDYLNNPASETPVPGYDAAPLPKAAATPLPKAAAAPLPRVAPRRMALNSMPAAQADAVPYGQRRIVVTRGDTLSNLAWHYKTTVTALLRANRLRHGNIEVGQELIIPARR